MNTILFPFSFLREKFFLPLVIFLVWGTFCGAQPIHLDFRAHLGAQIQSAQISRLDMRFETRNYTFSLLSPELSIQLSILDWVQIHAPVLQQNYFSDFTQGQIDIALLPPKKKWRPFLGLRSHWIEVVRTVDVEIDDWSDNKPEGRLFFDQFQNENRLILVPSVRYQINDHLFLSFECGIELGHRINEEFEIFEGDEEILEFFLDPNKTNYSLSGVIGLAQVDFPRDYPGYEAFYFQLGQRILPRFGLIARIF